MTRIISFESVLKKIPENKKPHLLLGNGFSISWNVNKFSYQSLLDKADFKGFKSNIKEVFQNLDTYDFEHVIKVLRDASKVVKYYNNKNLVDDLIYDANKLKETLAQTIANNHPEYPSEIDRDSYEHCKKFLSYFKHIYTLNYDLLLYWTIMQDEITPTFTCDDGFRNPDSDRESYVTWDIGNTNSQNIFYLHGALHLFDSGYELKKFTWVNTGIRLIEQIRDALSKDIFPVVVTEGKWEDKKARIDHSGYLNRGLRSFTNLTDPLIIFGHSLTDSDNHILKLMEKGKFKQLFISIYGNHKNKNNQRLINRAEKIRNSRNSKHPLELNFFNAETANVWG
ncbi:SIR2-like domain protein [Leptospira interrogans str. 2003000735]|uniref:SIR2-like domain protein n=2 Tax=Leptospira interrogans TaxID=173 RepID=A0A829CUD6_LEPIR|nr:DUF4917 family protein [Leptospira interrogans]EMY03234.1 SIR2-like domain protein [Leptospira interrogans str. 2002000626]EMY24239.1 SIR2-like domain protein [Leptospira interrogans serovar Australis str. 200703203]EKN87873.1 SIR2-like domain protein [Leptospira interrogans str. 2002000624]EKQ35900.1 SIR2-like domain protein [Leptospira interrogans str. 2002000621]EKQ47297.1 SIR2-like domain protein [Leptospira interrogans str. 2002000623]